MDLWLVRKQSGSIVIQLEALKGNENTIT